MVKEEIAKQRDGRTNGQTGRGDYNTPSKKHGDNKAEHHVTCTNWIRFIFIIGSPGHNMFCVCICTCMYLYFPMQDMDW